MSTAATPVPRALDLDFRNPGAGIAALDEFADLLVLNQQLGKILFAGVPRTQPIHHDAGAKTKLCNTDNRLNSYLMSIWVGITVKPEPGAGNLQSVPQ